MRLATDELNLTLVVSRRFAASPDRVFDAWFDPNAVGAWLFATPGGISKHVEIDACVGGGFAIHEQRGDSLALISAPISKSSVRTGSSSRSEPSGRRVQPS
jgi:hypothetical protein